MDSKPKNTTAIIHCRTDLATARYLQQRLKQYRLPKVLRIANRKSRLGGFWLCDEDARIDDIDERLARFGQLIVCCSHAAAHSKWMSDRTAAFIEKRGDSNIVAVIFEGQPNDALPKALLDRVAVTADFRPRADGRDTGALKVAAALSNIGPGGLRDAQVTDDRRRARWRTVAAAALALTTAGIAFEAVSARREAKSVRAQAEAAIAAETQIIAETARLKRTYDLPQQAVATLARLTDEQFSKLLDAPGQTTRLLKRRMHLQLALADLHGTIGDVAAQARHADEAVALLRGGLPAQDVVSADYVLALAAQGQARFAEGDVHAAEKAYRDAIAVGRKAITGRPEKATVYLRLAAALQGLGRIYIGEDRAADAITLFEDAQLQLEEAGRRSVHVPKASARAVEGLNWLGSARSLAGQTQSAVDTFRSAVQRAQSSLRTQPLFGRLLDARGKAQMKLGQALADLGRHDEARAYVAASVKAARKLASDAPRATPFQKSLALRLALQANIDLERDVPEAAIDALDESNSIYDWLVASDADDVTARIDYAQSLALKASAHEKLDHTAAVLSTRQRAARLWAKLVDPTKERRWGRLEALAVAYERWGDAAAKAQNIDQMLSAYGRAEPLRRRMRAYRDDEPAKIAHAKALHALGLTRKFAQSLGTAAKALDEAAKLRLQIASPPSQFAAAESLQQLALIQVGTDAGAGKASLIKAREVLRSLVSSHPNRPAYGASLKKTEQMLALITAQGPKR